MRLLAILVALASSPAQAEIVSASEHGFALQSSITVSASPAQSYAMIGKIGRWWSDSHTYSGKAANMRLPLHAGSCFCEAIPAQKGSVQHGQVVQVQPGKLIRLSAALGPLQAEGVTGSLSWMLEPVAGGGTRITQTYVVGGYIRGGAASFAKPVDGVLMEQLGRLGKALDVR